MTHGNANTMKPLPWRLRKVRSAPWVLPNVMSGQPSLFQSAVLTAAPYTPSQFCCVMPQSGAWLTKTWAFANHVKPKANMTRHTRGVANMNPI